MAQDRTAEQREPREADRPPEVQPPQADLAARLERLPIGHPSSPHRDDGSRKPPPETCPSTNSLSLTNSTLLRSQTHLLKTRVASAPTARGLGRTATWHRKNLALPTKVLPNATMLKDATPMATMVTTASRPLCGESRRNSTVAPWSKVRRGTRSKSLIGSRKNSLNRLETNQISLSNNMWTRSMMEFDTHLSPMVETMFVP